MAQLLFESIPVLSKVSSSDSSETSTALTVHRMLEQPLITQYETAPVPDDSDVFQCGRCKKQFSSIDVFVNHKTECNNSVNKMSDISLPSNVSGLPQNTVLVQKIQVPSSSLSSYPQSLVLNENEVVQFTATEVNSNIAALGNSSIQISPNSIVHRPVGNIQPTQIHQVLRHLITANDSNQFQVLELSPLNDKIISRPMILTSPQHTNAVQSLVLNISGPSQPQTIICNPETDKSNATVTEPVSETVEVINENEQAVTEKEPSTVNIINEFHSSMVKTQKQSSDAENEENQVKKDHRLNCAYCWKSFAKNFDLQQHIRCHTGEKPFQCIVCGRAFAQKSNVKKHMQTHKVWPDGLARTLPPLPSKNSSSSSSNASQDCLDNPMEQKENLAEKEQSGEIDKNSYVCPYCKYIGKNYYKLKSHMKQHDTEKVYKCIVSSCGQMFNDLDPFLEHARSHENEMTYRCHECNKNFSSLFDLGNHQLTHAACLKVSKKSPVAKKYFQCNLCLNKYSTPAALDHHLATSSHTYSCTLCDKVFPCERYLRRHLQIHSEAESYTCNICEKGFRTESYLKVHMIVHSEEKPYECTTCNSAFNRKDKLKRHLLIHEPIKRFKCPFRSRGCPKEFNRPDKLKSHILTHSCIKPFTCKICGRTFTRKSHLRDHIKQNHEENDLKLLDDVDQSDENSCKSPLEEDCEKLHKCKKLNSNRRRKTFNGNYRTYKQRKRAENSRSCERLSKKAKLKELLRLQSIIDDSSKDIDSVSDLTDDIPTAHIEIISANGTLVSGSDLTHISLGSDMNYGDLQFETGVVTVDVPNDSPIRVEVIDMSNSNSLLTSELHHSTDIDDFS